MIPRILLPVFLLAAESQACSVCTGALPPRTLNAYLLMSLLMTLLPFGLLGTGLWVWRGRMGKNGNVNAESGHERN